MSKHRFSHPLLVSVIAASVTLSLFIAPPAFGQGFKKIVVFGTSLSDPGNHFIEFGVTSFQPFAPVPDASYAIGGHRFTNGATWVERVATGLHLPNSGNPALRTPGTFTNYSFGRARARQCNSFSTACPDGPYPFGVADLGFEVQRFLVDFAGSAPSDGLYVIEIGANDINDAMMAYTTDGGVTSGAIIQAAIASEAYNIGVLYAAGARVFLVPTAPNLALTPYVSSLGTEAQFLATTFATIYNGAVDQMIAALTSGLPGIQFQRFVFNAAIAAIEADPGKFGITDATHSCLTFGVTGDAICATPNKYLWWDGIHPTTAGHAVVAAAVLDMLLE